MRTMLFSFNDLPRLSQRARALLFDKLSTEVVVLALRSTEADFREPVLSAMASRSRRLVESELANPSSAPAAEIEKARRQIVKLVLVMAQRGEIELPQRRRESERRGRSLPRESSNGRGHDDEQDGRTDGEADRRRARAAATCRCRARSRC